MTMATASVPHAEPNEMECPVCHDKFTAPKLLTCGHLLCRHCLVQWLKSSPQTDCPLCRCAVVGREQRNSGKSFKELVDALPDDLVMAALAEGQHMLSSQHKCTACNTEAAEPSLCVDCSDVFCPTCATRHIRSSMARDHKLQELSTLTAKDLADARPMFCPRHRGQVASMFCNSHQVTLCLKCAFIEHHTCIIVEIETKLEEKRKTLQDMAARLKAGETEQEQAISRLEQHLDENKKLTAAAAAEIQTACDRLESAVTSCRNRLEELVTDVGFRIEDSVKGGKTCLEKRRGKLTLHRHVVERAADSSNFDAVSGMTSSMETCVNGLDLSATLPADASVIPSVLLTIDPEAVSDIVQAIEKLGQLTIAQAPGVVAVKPPLLCFHLNHGKCIRLSADEQTAERTSEIGNGIVLSSKPMQMCMLYEVRIDQTIDWWQFERVCLGAVTESPDAVLLPDWAGHLKNGVVLNPNWVKTDGGDEVKNFVVEKLREVREGGHVGLALDGNRNLHLYVDGVCQPQPIATQIAEPCYFMIDVHACWKKVTAMPIKVLQESERTARDTQATLV